MRRRAAGPAPLRTFGPTWFTVETAREGVSLKRTVLCPEGEGPWVLVRVEDRRAGGASRQSHPRRGVGAPAAVFERRRGDGGHGGKPGGHWQANAERHVAFEVETACSVWRGPWNCARGDLERPLDKAWQMPGYSSSPAIFGAPARLVLEVLGETEAEAATDGSRTPPCGSLRGSSFGCKLSVKCCGSASDARTAPVAPIPPPPLPTRCESLPPACPALAPRASRRQSGRSPGMPLCSPVARAATGCWAATPWGRTRPTPWRLA